MTLTLKLSSLVLAHDQQHNQSAFDEQIRQDNHLQTSVDESVQSHMVEHSEAVDNTSDSTELVGLHNSTVSLSRDERMVINPLSLLSLLFNSGGQVKSLTSSRAIVDIRGQTIVIVFTQDKASFKDYSRKSVALPESIAKLRDYLISWGVHSIPAMAGDVPIIVIFGSPMVVSSTSIHSILVCITYTFHWYP